MISRYVLYTMALGALACAASPAAEPSGPNIVLNSSKLRNYVARFNADDEQLYANIPNAEAFSFLEQNIPLFECPDPDCIGGNIPEGPSGGPFLPNFGFVTPGEDVVITMEWDKVSDQFIFRYEDQIAILDKHITM